MTGTEISDDKTNDLIDYENNRIWIFINVDAIKTSDGFCIGAHEPPK